VSTITTLFITVLPLFYKGFLHVDMLLVFSNLSSTQVTRRAFVY
jgi:hypothetical protein